MAIRGRSALYKMSRSPFFKVHAANNSRVGLCVRDVLASSSTSPSPKIVLSANKQVLKRGSSVLDNDSGSLGPVQRTRRKSLLMSSSQRDSSPSRATSLSPDVGNGKSTYPFATIGHVPPQSTEMAKKIFQELGKLVPFPSEKLPEKKEFNSQRHQGSGDCDAASDSPSPTLRSSISPKQSIKENGPSHNAIAVGKATREDGDAGSSVTSATIVKPAHPFHFQLQHHKKNLMFKRLWFRNLLGRMLSTVRLVHLDYQSPGFYGSLCHLSPIPYPRVLC